MSAARADRTPAARKRRDPAPGTARENTVGSELERRVARIEFAEGAYARLRVPVPAPGGESGRDVLTDIDVLSIDVDLRLRLTRSSAECKSGRGQSGEPSTIVWLAGFRQLLKLTKVAFVRPTVSNRGRVLARRLDISVVDEQTLATREAAHKWIPERFAHIDGERCVAAEARTDVQLRGLPGVPGPLTQFIRNEALLAESPALLAGVESLGRSYRDQGVLPEPAGLTLAAHAYIAIILAAIQDAGRLNEVSRRELRARLEKGLATGNPDDDYLLPLLEKADALVKYISERTHRAYTSSGAEPIDLPMPSLREIVASPPSYLDDYLDLVDRFRANPVVSRDLLQSAELACFEYLLGGDIWASPAFAHLFTAEHKGLLLVVLRCLTRVAGPEVSGWLEGLRDLKVSSAVAVPDRSATANNTTTDARHPRTAATKSVRQGGPIPLEGLGDEDAIR